MVTVRVLLISLIAYCWHIGAVAEERSVGVSAAPQNYEFTLRYQSPDGVSTTIRFVASSGAFEVSSHNPSVFFSGSILGVEGDTLRLQYRLETERAMVVGGSSSGGQQTSTMNRVQAGVSSTLQLALDAPMLIYAAGDERAQLRVTVAMPHQPVPAAGPGGVWESFGTWGTQDFIDFYPNVFDGALAYLADCTPAERLEFIRHLEGVLGAERSEAELFDVWLASGVNVVFDGPEGTTRRLLEGFLHTARTGEAPAFEEWMSVVPLGEPVPER